MLLLNITACNVLIIWIKSVFLTHPTWFLIVFRLQLHVRQEVLHRLCCVLLGLRCFPTRGRGTGLWRPESAPVLCCSTHVTVGRGCGGAGGAGVCGDPLQLLLLP